MTAGGGKHISPLPLNDLSWLSPPKTSSFQVSYLIKMKTLFQTKTIMACNHYYNIKKVSNFQLPTVNRLCSIWGTNIRKDKKRNSYNSKREERENKKVIRKRRSMGRI